MFLSSLRLVSQFLNPRNKKIDHHQTKCLLLILMFSLSPSNSHSINHVNKIRQRCNDSSPMPQCLLRNDKNIKYTDNFDCDNILSIPLPPKPSSKPPTDIDMLSDKYWDGMLERTLSSTTLNGSQKINCKNDLQSAQLDNNYAITSAGSDGSSGAGSSSNGGGVVVAVKDCSNKQCGRRRSSEHHLVQSPLSYAPRYCEHLHDLHELHCAKNIAFFGDLRDDM